MYIQGDLQKVFDALYSMGVIDPVLEEDWNKALTELPNYYDQVDKAIAIINMAQGQNLILSEELEKVDERVLAFVAMEVAKEFANFHAREELH